VATINAAIIALAKAFVEQGIKDGVQVNGVGLEVFFIATVLSLKFPLWGFGLGPVSCFLICGQKPLGGAREDGTVC
jgi:hypothetical protein